MKPAYLIVGDDEGKIDAALDRLRSRGEREGAVLESFGSGTEGPPDPEALIAAIPAMSLMSSRRYLLADGVERWTAKQAASVIEALAALPPELTVVFIARERSPRQRRPKGLAEAVEGAGGDVLRYAAPRARDLPARLIEDAGRRGFKLDAAAARVLVERMGEGTLRLANELDRLALWAGPDGEVTPPTWRTMVADTSKRPPGRCPTRSSPATRAPRCGAAERLVAGRGHDAARLPGGPPAARRERRARATRGGHAAKKVVEGTSAMHPYAAKMLVRRLRGRTPSRTSAPPAARSPISSGGPAGGRSIRTTWR